MIISTKGKTTKQHDNLFVELLLVGADLKENKRSKTINILNYEDIKSEVDKII